MDSPFSKILNSEMHYHIYNEYVISTPKRDELKAHMNEKGASTAIYYPVSLHMQQCFENLGYKAVSFPEGESASERTLALPVYPELTKEQLQYVVDSVVEGIT